MQKAILVVTLLACAGLGGCVSTGADGNPAFILSLADPAGDGAARPADTGLAASNQTAAAGPQAAAPAPPPPGMMAEAPLPPRRPVELGGRPPLVLASEDEGDAVDPDEDEPLSAMDEGEPAPSLADEAHRVVASASLSPGSAPVKTTGPGYYAAYQDTVISCFPPALSAALNTIAEHFNKPVEVTSGLRTHGRPGSLHRRCMAADIRIAGVAPSSIEAFAKTVPTIHGVGSYHRTDLIHVDIRQETMAGRY
jgi:hypothetical protein